MVLAVPMTGFGTLPAEKFTAGDPDGGWIFIVAASAALVVLAVAFVGQSESSWCCCAAGRFGLFS